MYTVKPMGDTMHQKTSSMGTGGALSSSNEGDGLSHRSSNMNHLVGNRGSELTGMISGITLTNGEFSGCKHAELISYKVHQDQFKSLLVPNRLSGVWAKGKNSRANNAN